MAMSEHDITLVTAAKTGDSSAFEELYSRYYGKIFALARMTVKNDANAEDVLQETFILAWRNLHNLETPATFSTWLQKITLNQCYSLLRKKNIAVPLDADDDIEAYLEEPSDELLPAVYAERDDLRIRLGKIIDGLSDVQKQTVVLFYFNEQKVEEIAEIMQCNAGTVKKRLFLARKAIRTEVEEQERKSGEKFYGIAGIPMLAIGDLLKQQIEAAVLSAADIYATALAAVTQAITQGAAAGSAAAAGASAGAATSAAVGAAGSAATGAAAGATAAASTATGLSLTAKVSLIAASVIVSAGILLGGYYLLANDRNPSDIGSAQMDDRPDEPRTDPAISPTNVRAPTADPPPSSEANSNDDADAEESPLAQLAAELIELYETQGYEAVHEVMRTEAFTDVVLPALRASGNAPNIFSTATGTGCGFYLDRGLFVYIGEYEGLIRSGSGVWLNVNPNDIGTYAFLGHWRDDLPNGEGRIVAVYSPGSSSLGGITISTFMNGLAEGAVNLQLLNEDRCSHSFNFTASGGSQVIETRIIDGRSVDFFASCTECNGAFWSGPAPGVLGLLP